jgi:hypothetical protein
MSAAVVFAGAFSSLLTSVSLRYDVAMPSVWLRRRGYNSLQFNDFPSDSPLNLSSFLPDSRSVPGELYIGRFLASRLESLSSQTVSQYRLHCPRSVVGFSSHGLAWRSLVRESCAGPCVSEYDGQLPAVPHLERITEHKCCLKVNRKSDLNQGRVGHTIHAELGDPVMNTCPPGKSRQH